MSVNQPETLRHTPAPWYVRGGSIVAKEGDIGCQYVADLSSPNGVDQRDANAAFIVEVVNSHERLTARVAELTKSITRLVMAWDTFEKEQLQLDEGVEQAIDDCRAALSAADGK